MNDGTNIASDDIILKPKFRYWLMKNFLLITLAIFVFIFSKYIRAVSYTHLTLPTT